MNELSIGGVSKSCQENDLTTPEPEEGRAETETVCQGGPGPGSLDPCPITFLMKTRSSMGSAF
jgi:hypothetical protein